MEFAECVKTRRSIRKYKDEKVSHDTFEEIIGMATYAPSWKNSQIARYTLVEDEKLRHKIAEECLMGHPGNNSIIHSAPALVVLSIVEKRSGYERDGSPSTSKGECWQSFDGGIAAQTFCLAAHSMGYGTVIMGIFDDAKVAAAIGLPEGQLVAALIALGRPDDAPAAPKRKTAAELITYK